MKRTNVTYCYEVYQWPIVGFEPYKNCRLSFCKSPCPQMEENESNLSTKAALATEVHSR